MPKPIVGRHIREGDILYVDIPEEHAKMLRDRFAHRLSEDSPQALQELIEIKRRSNPIWAI